MFASNNSAVTIDSLSSKDNGPIWVANNTQFSEPPGADIFITAYVGKQGNPAILNIPLTWAPLNLNEQAPRAAILDSQHFLRAVSSGAIRLLTEAEANELIARPSYNKEVERLRQIKDAVRNATVNPNSKNFELTLDEGESQTGVQQTKAKAKTNLSAGEFEEEAISVSFKAWANKLNQMEVEDAIEALKLRANFDTIELEFIRDTTKHSRIRAGMERKIEELKGE